jgi:hypothetical protein
MTMNPLPPQAYTKETLVLAYEWLNKQSKEIREIAGTPDILVSLYNKAKLQGDECLERPSIQNFKNELKNLAGMMGEFEVVEPEIHSRPSPRTQATPLQTAPMQSVPTPKAAAPATAPAQTMAQTQTAALGLGLDSRTQAMLAQLREQYNLSSENEALRMAVSIGAKKLLGLLN